MYIDIYKILICFLIAVVTFIIYRLLKLAYNRIFKHRKETLRNKLDREIILILLVTMALTTCTAQFSTGREIINYFIKNVAFLVAIVGFSAQQVLGDVLAGIMIAIFKPFELGERVNIVSRDTTGIVEDINLRHTVIKCFDNNRLIIPNSVINKEILKNTDYVDSLSGSFIEITVSYDSDIEKAMDIMRDIILRCELTKYRDKGSDCDKELEILVRGLTGSGVELKVVVWTDTVDNNFKACSKIRLEIAEQFRLSGIRITG